MPGGRMTRSRRCDWLVTLILTRPSPMPSASTASVPSRSPSSRLTFGSSAFFEVSAAGLRFFGVALLVERVVVAWLERVCACAERLNKTKNAPAIERPGRSANRTNWDMTSLPSTIKMNESHESAGATMRRRGLGKSNRVEQRQRGGNTKHEMGGGTSRLPKTLGGSGRIRRKTIVVGSTVTSDRRTDLARSQ